MRLATFVLVLASSSPLLARTNAPTGQTPPAQTPTPEDARVQKLEQSLAASEARVNKLEQQVGQLKQEAEQQRQQAAQGVQALQQLNQLQTTGRTGEQDREARVVTIDAVEKELTALEAQMALGNTVTPEDLSRIQEDLTVLQANAMQQSGREEVIYLTSAIQSLGYAIQLLEGAADYFTTRQQLFVAIDNIVAARNSATGNPMPAWRGGP
jgi:hypothetical protein